MDAATNSHFLAALERRPDLEDFLLLRNMVASVDFNSKLPVQRAWVNRGIPRFFDRVKERQLGAN